MCKDCEKNYKCEYCGKICKTHRGLELHMKSCKEKSNEITNVNESIEKDFNVEIKNFFDALGGRMTANRLEIEKIFNWYRKIYPGTSMNLTYGCPSCVQHAFKRVKEYYNKIK